MNIINTHQTTHFIALSIFIQFSSIFVAKSAFSVTNVVDTLFILVSTELFQDHQLNSKVPAEHIVTVNVNNSVITNVYIIFFIILFY